MRAPHPSRPTYQNFDRALTESSAQSFMRNTSGSGCASVGTCRPTTWYWWYCAGRTRVIASCQSPTSLSPRRSSSPPSRLARVHHRTNHRERVACISLFHLGPSPPLPGPRPPSRARPRAPIAIEPKPQTARSGRPVRRRLRVHRIEPPPRHRVTARVVVVVVVARTLNFAMMPCEARRVEADGAARVASLTDRTGAPSGLPPKWSVFGLKYA